MTGHDDRRLSSTARGYGYRWQKQRARYLAEHPLCNACATRGRIKAANVVDHKIAHRGDDRLFWDQRNWQGLCKDCHDAKREAEEAHGVINPGVGVDGLPLSPRHHWNR